MQTSRSPSTTANFTELRDYLQVLRRRWYVIVATVVVLVGVALAWSLATEASYRSSVRVLVNQPRASQIFDPVTGDMLRPERVVENEVAFVQSDVVESAAEQQLGRQVDIEVRSASDADVLIISATAGDPDEAAQAAQTYADSYIDLRRQQTVDDYQATAAVVSERIEALDEEIEDKTAQGADQSEIDRLTRQRETYAEGLDNLLLTADLTNGAGAQIISPAEVPEQPYEPQPVRNVAIATAVGLLLGVGLAFLVDYLDRSVKSKEDIEQALPGVANLAVVPALTKWRNKQTTELVTLDEPHSAAAESYRTLRTSLQFMALDGAIQVIQVTSPDSGDGKSTTASNLAVAMAQADRRVILVDCDLRRPRINEFFGTSQAPGVTNALLGEIPWQNTARLIDGVRNLVVIPSGPPPPEPSELLAGRRTTDLFGQFRKYADVIIVDSPPVLPLSDALVIARLVDATVLVGRPGRATGDHLRQAYESLAKVGAPVVGTVLNQAQAARRKSYGYGYLYGYETIKAQPPAPQPPHLQDEPSGNGTATDSHPSTNGHKAPAVARSDHGPQNEPSDPEP